jgi:hypothetical protein
MRPDWQKSRSEFNHDWLKNKFLRHLSACIRRLESPNPDEARLAEFFNEDLLEWESRRADAERLLKAFEHEMSPRKLLTVPPLSRFDDNTKRWLGDLVHGLWLARYSVRSWLQNANRALAGADGSYKRVRQSLRKPETAKNRIGELVREDMACFRDRCVELTEALSEFPSEIQIV